MVSKQLLKKRPRQQLAKKLRLIRSGITAISQGSFVDQLIYSDCNLKLKIEPWKTPIPVIFHNFWGYDSHLVCESVGKSANARNIRVIAETFERYKSMKVGQLKYIDSMQFMNSSLAKLTENLGDKHPLTSRYFKSQGYTDKQISLAMRKGIYPMTISIHRIDSWRQSSHQFMNFLQH